MNKVNPTGNAEMFKLYSEEQKKVATLESENEALREALEKIKDIPHKYCWGWGAKLHEIYQIARKAIQQGKEDKND